jgi:hypothetical protein
VESLQKRRGIQAEYTNKSNREGDGENRTG